MHKGLSHRSRRWLFPDEACCAARFKLLDGLALALSRRLRRRELQVQRGQVPLASRLAL